MNDKKVNSMPKISYEDRENEIYVNGLNEIRESITKCNVDVIGDNTKNDLLDMIDEELAKYK